MRINITVPKLLEPLTKKILKVIDKRKKISTEKLQKLFWGDNAVVEFWMGGFNDEGLTKAFGHIYAIYEEILHKDPQWHYFYEDRYTLIRCSYKYSGEVKKYLDDNNIKYKWPIQNWVESCYVTVTYQDIYKEIFHNFSVLIIEMFKNKDGSKLYTAADRVIHPFFVQALYLADVEGQLDYYQANNVEPMFWEAHNMAGLTASRAYHIGTIKGERDVVAYYKNKDINKEKEDI